MKAKLIAVGALAAALLIAGVPLGAGSATADDKTTVMFAGDSITQGRNGDYTWRYRFATEVQRQGTSTVDFVGPKKAPTSYGSTYSHYLAGGWDTDHDATSGTMLSQQTGKIGAEVATYKPDILISYLGTNDFLEVPRDHKGATAAELLPLYQAKIDEVMDNWATYVDAVRASKPAIKIVLGELVTPQIPEGIRQAYNDRLKSFSTSQWALGSPIEIAQLSGSVWSSSQYLYDGIHPTPTGETFLAQSFATAVDEIDSSLFPAPIQIFRNVAWNPPLKAKVEVIGGRIKIDWSFAASYNSATKMRAKLVTVRNGNERLSPFRTAPTWSSSKLKPGTYRVRIQANRTFMNSTWSPAIVVKVPRPRVAN